MIRNVARGIIAIVIWSIILSPVLGLVSSFLLPPDPFSTVVILVPLIGLAVLAGVLSEARSVSQSQLLRFAIAVYAVTLVIGVLPVTYFQNSGQFGSLLAVVLTLFLILAIYILAYYFSYGEGYDQLKAWYRSSS